MGLLLSAQLMARLVTRSGVAMPCSLMLAHMRSPLGNLQGSLLVHADCVMGHMEGQAPPSTGRAAATTAAAAATTTSGSRHVPSGSVRKVHNGVEHSATTSGAFGSVPLRHASSRTHGQPGGSQPQQAAELQLVYSNRCGRVRLINVRVQNQGVDWEHPNNVYWKHKVRH
jgi:hypothetical protein